LRTYILILIHECLHKPAVRLGLESHKCCEKPSTVPNKHNIINKWDSLFDLILDSDWRNILPSSCNNQLLYSSSDEQYAIFVNVAEVSRVQKSVCINGLGSLFWILEVTHENVAASVAYLTDVINYFTLFISWIQRNYL
jgi:hypothetical protein